jgi:hypothetical protein
VLKEPKRIIYYYDDDQHDREVEEDFGGDIRIPPQGAIIDRRARRWRVAAVNKEQECRTGAIPDYVIVLRSLLA